jgi:Na+/H+ antiporter NhaA
MFGGKIGWPELFLIIILLVIIAVPITAVKMRRQSTYYALGVVFATLMSCSELHRDIGAVVGALLVFLFVSVIPALFYWVIAGRRSDIGKLRTSKIFFWLAYLLPLLERWSESINR